MRHGRKRNILHHTLAAIGGFIVAALMVFLVFDSASEQGAAQDGDAPTAGVGAVSTSCGSVALANVGSDEAVATALDELPIIRDASGQPVNITDDGQRAWFAGLHAAVSVCADDISLQPNENPSQLTVTVTAPAEWSKARASKHAHAMLTVAFDNSPFAIKRTKLILRHADATRTVNVTVPVWVTFRDSAASLKLQPSVAGLQKLNRRVGYKSGELNISGW